MPKQVAKKKTSKTEKNVPVAKKTSRSKPVVAKAEKTAKAVSTPIVAKAEKAARAVTPRPSQDKNAGQAKTKLSPKERATNVTGFLGKNIRKPKVFVPVLIIVLLALLYIFKSAFVVAMVNGQPITRAQFNQELQAQAGKQVMGSLVTETLVEQEASKRHITVSQSEINSQVKTIQAQLAQQGQTLDSALAARGMTQDEFMTQLKLQTLIQKMFANQIKVTPQQVNDYISKNKDSLPTGESQTQLQAQVKQQLEQQQLSQDAQNLIQKLQNQAHITYFVNL